jgi:hypothetical protein
LFEKYLFILSVLDDSDTPMGLIKHLPVRLLKKKVTTKKRKFSALGGNKKRVENDDEEMDEDDITDNANAQQQIEWSRKNLDQVGSKIPSYKKP